MKISMSWSGGKDSAFALYHLINDPDHEVAELHTVVDEVTGRIPMHEVSLELIREQARAIGLPLRVIRLPAFKGNGEYEKRMQAFVDDSRDKGIKALAYGDIFLEDLKTYRENMLKGTGLKALFPLWQQPTDKLIEAFINFGFKTCICAVNERYLDPEHLGETIGSDWLSGLTHDTDPCGENGEFHTFTYDGPVFSHPVRFLKGKKITKKYPDPQTAGETIRLHYLPLLSIKEKN